MGLSFPKENTSGILFPGASIIKQQTGKGQCPNPWTTLFVTENGNVSLCFLSEPVDNLYKTPLSEIWNCRQAVAKRSRILAGYYTESGCSKLWCDWRNGKVTTPPNNNDWQELLNSFRALTGQLKFREATSVPFSVDQDLSAVRRILKAQENRIAELESNLQLLWSDNTQILTFMEKRIYELKAKLSGTKKITTSVFDLMWIHWLWMRKIWHHLRIFWTKFRH